MAYNTYIEQGRFTGAGATETINLRGDIDWMHVWNITVLTAGGAATGVEFIWQRGMADGEGIIYTKLAADDSTTIGYMTTGGFTVVDDNSDPFLGALNTTITDISNATPPAVSITSTTGLSEDDTVRLINVTGAQQFGGIDFTLDTLVANTSFNLPFAPTIVTATTGSLRRVNRESLYYPRSRYISSITQAASAVVELTVIHDYNVGELVRFQVSADFDMTEIDGLLGEITAVDATNNTITVDIDSAAFTAFAWPLTADVPFTPAQVLPVGDDPTVLTGATENEGIIAMQLAAGTTSPAGATNDVIYWQAGKSFDVIDDL